MVINPKLKRVPTFLDRYPAKMVSHLAARLIDRYADNAETLLDPFCGSCAILKAAQFKNINVTGIDINPISSLYSSVKLKSFSTDKAKQLAKEVVFLSKANKRSLPINWSNKNYWFTKKTLDKLELLRNSSRELKLNYSKEGKAILLSMALSIRLCSLADQRSPKPFISKNARIVRSGLHFDPYKIFLNILEKLGMLYGDMAANNDAKFFNLDVRRLSQEKGIKKYSHIITSPPYINAQDYFRNFKLELYFLENILSFNVNDVKSKFIGTERGNLLSDTNEIEKKYIEEIIPLSKTYIEKNQRLCKVIQRYFSDMNRSFEEIKNCLNRNGVFVIVCGDNLVGGKKISTWKILNQMLSDKGFKLFDYFQDKIENRILAPKRSGHKGLIKEEVVCAFKL